MLQWRSVVIVKVFKNVICLVTIICCRGRLSVNSNSQCSDTAMLLTSLVITVTLGAYKVRVGAFSLQMMLKSWTSNLSFLARCTCNLLLRARFPMSDLLSNFEWCTTALIRAFDDTVAALAEDVICVVVEWNCFALALVVETGESGAIEHWLLDWVKFIDGLDRLLTALAGCNFSTYLAWPTDQFVALAAVTCFDSGALAVSTESRLGEHGVGAIVERFHAALHFGPVIKLRFSWCCHICYDNFI